MLQIKIVFWLVTLFVTSPIYALDNSVDKQVTVTGSSTIGTPLPPTCTGDKALQWDGNTWQCNAVSGSGPMKPWLAESIRDDWRYLISVEFTGLVRVRKPSRYSNNSNVQLDGRQFKYTIGGINIPIITALVNGVSGGSGANKPSKGGHRLSLGFVYISTFQHPSLRGVVSRVNRSPNKHRRLVFKNNGSTRDVYGKLVPDFDISGF